MKMRHCGRKTLDEYIGQKDLKQKSLTIFIQAALQRNEALDHVLA